jgi:subfamily B ATP-binding cassette protein MsbA
VADAPALRLVQVFTHFWPQARPLRWWMVLGVVLLAAAPLIAIAEIFLFQRLVDDVLVPADLGPLLGIGALFVGLNVLSAVVSGGDDYLSTWVSQRFLVSLRTTTFRHVLALPLHLHEQRRLGDVLSRLTSDIGSVEAFMVRYLANGVGAVLRLLFFVAALFWLQWDLALASMLVVPVFWLISTKFAGFVKDVSRERARRGGSLSSVAEEALASAPLVQAYNREDEAVDGFHRQTRGIAEAELAASRIRSAFLPVVDLAELVGILCVIGLGTWALSTDRLSLGGLLAFLALMGQCYRPIRELSDLLPALFAAAAGAERVVELLDEPEVHEDADARPWAHPRGYVRFEDVTVRYPGAHRDALHDVSFSASPGEVVAIVGPSGSGKSTLARVLTRQVELTAGQVTLDGHPTERLTIASTRAAVAVVLQEVMLLDTSVRANIAYADPEAGPDRVEEAARAADADSFIRLLPAGYDTRIGQRGRSLSGGQRQRLSLARALLRGSKVLVLDEPTTGLDPDSARRILTPLRSAAAGRTVLLITHDPVAVEFADRVVHLDEGTITPAAPERRHPARPIPTLSGGTR